MREKLKAPRIPSYEETEYIRIMEKYGAMNGGIKEDNLCYLVFSKELTDFHARELRLFQERYSNLKYIGYYSLGKIIKRNGMYKLITIDNAQHVALQNKALTDFYCALASLRNTIKLYGTMKLDGQLGYDVTKLMEVTDE